MARYTPLNPKGTSGTGAAVRSLNTGRAINTLGRTLNRNVQQADIDRINHAVGGNLSEYTVKVTFTTAGKEQFIGHKLGYRVDNFEPISPDKPAQFSMGSTTPNLYGMWLKSDTAGVTVRIRMYGQRTGKR